MKRLTSSKTATTRKMDTAEQLVRDGAKLLWTSMDKDGPFWVFAAEDALTWSMLNSVRATAQADEIRSRLIGQAE